RPEAEQPRELPGHAWPDGRTVQRSARQPGILTQSFPFSPPLRPSVPSAEARRGHAELPLLPAHTQLSWPPAGPYASSKDVYTVPAPGQPSVPADRNPKRPRGLGRGGVWGLCFTIGAGDQTVSIPAICLMALMAKVRVRPQAVPPMTQG